MSPICGLGAVSHTRSMKTTPGSPVFQADSAISRHSFLAEDGLDHLAQRSAARVPRVDQRPPRRPHLRLA